MTPPQLWHLEPDRLDETLVFHNSRSEGHWGIWRIKSWPRSLRSSPRGVRTSR
jgi:hypothetical protein